MPFSGTDYGSNLERKFEIIIQNFEIPGIVRCEDEMSSQHSPADSIMCMLSK